MVHRLLLTALAVPPIAGPARAEEPPAALPQVTLTGAVERAMERNPSVAVAFDEVSRAEALVRQARAAWWPSLSANATYTRLDHARELSGKVISGQDQVGANLTLAAPLFAPRAWTAGWHAQDNLVAVQASSAEAKRVVALAVGRSYLTVLAQRRIVEVSLRATLTAQAHADFARSRFTGGVGNRVDVVRAEQELAADRQRVETGQTGLARAREALGVLLGQDGPVDAAEEPTLGSAPPLAHALEDSARRGDLQALAARSSAAQRVVQDRWADYTPVLGALVQPFFQDPPTLTQPETGWQAQLIFSWSLYDGGLRYGVQREREVLAREAQTGLEAGTRQARSEVRAAHASLEHADAALVSARAAAQLAHEALELSGLAYRAGATTNIEVIDAERTALDADTSAEVAGDDARQARLDLLSASGRFP